MQQSKEETLRFVSWNVNGVLTEIKSSEIKICYILSELKNHYAKIVFLQETHIGSNNFNELIHYTDGWERFFTIYDSKSKGVAILIRKNVPFKYICHDEDYSGGYLVLFCYIHNELFTLVNVYNHKHDTGILNRLQEYLRETAVGVLVVGGDFNTVLDLTFDQEKATGHTALRDSFERFTDSLNLMDTWTCLHPTEKAFTHYQKGKDCESSSRLDMFLMPEDVMERVSSVNICETEMIQTKDVMRKISDHQPVVLELSCSTSITSDASRFNTFTYRKHERAAKINGAEILSVINSLTDSQQVHPNGISIQTYKTNHCQFSKSLKEPFNDFLNCKKIPDDFKKCVTCLPSNRKVFNVDYLIFTMILAKRLSMLLLVPPENKSQSSNDCHIVSFSEKPVRLKWTFLKKVLSDLCDTWKKYKVDKKQPQSDFRILEALGLTKSYRVLDNILPKVSSSSDDLRELQIGCPLTRSILSLLLKYMQILFKKGQYETHICSFRQVLIIHKTSTDQEHSKVQELLKEFSDNGTKLSILKMNKS